MAVSSEVQRWTPAGMGHGNQPMRTWDMGGLGGPRICTPIRNLPAARGLTKGESGSEKLTGAHRVNVQWRFDTPKLAPSLPAYIPGGRHPLVCDVYREIVSIFVPHLFREDWWRISCIWILEQWFPGKCPPENPMPIEYFHKILNHLKLFHDKHWNNMKQPSFFDSAFIIQLLQHISCTENAWFPLIVQCADRLLYKEDLIFVKAHSKKTHYRQQKWCSKIQSYTYNNKNNNK